MLKTDHMTEYFGIGGNVINFFRQYSCKIFRYRKYIAKRETFTMMESQYIKRIATEIYIVHKNVGIICRISCDWDYWDSPQEQTLFILFT